MKVFLPSGLEGAPSKGASEQFCCLARGVAGRRSAQARLEERTARTGNASSWGRHGERVGDARSDNDGSAARVEAVAARVEAAPVLNVWTARSATAEAREGNLVAALPAPHVAMRDDGGSGGDWGASQRTRLVAQFRLL